MKRIFLFASTILILILITTAQLSFAAPIVEGDLNSDGEVTSDDAIFLLMHSQFPDDERYALNQELRFQKCDKVSSEDAIYLLLYTEFPYDYPLYAVTKKMKYETIGAYKDTYTSSGKVGEIIYGYRYRVTKKKDYGGISWSYISEAGGWVPSSVLVTKDTYLPETYTYKREYIEPGSISDTVREMQNAMNRLGYRTEKGNKLTVNGVYGPELVYAVKLFQEDYDLGPDGVAGATGATWSKIDEIGSYQVGVTFSSKTDAYINHKTKTSTIESGKEGLAVHTTPGGWSYIRDIDVWVKSSAYVDRVSLTPYRNDSYTPHTINTVKKLLNGYKFYNKSGQKLTLDGKYDADFYYALCNFQDAIGLNKVGDMPYNGKTWWGLQSYIPINVNYPALYPGMTSSYSFQLMPYISLLNRFLNQLGYSAEKTNIAYWTNATLSAVKAFQTDYDLGADGYVGYGTWNKLIRKVVNDTSNSDSTFEAYLKSQGFPESYKVYLRRLHKLHPNWVFVAEKIDKTWPAAVSMEYVNNGSQPVSLMSKYWATCLQSTEFSGKTYDGGEWVVPSKTTIQYFMDPRNFLDETTIFQFFGDTTYDSMYTEKFVSEVATLLGMTYMSGSYTHKDGTTINYPKVIVDACKKYNFNPVMLLASIKQEIGTSPEADLISGSYSSYEGYYNYINYGAYQDGDIGPKLRGIMSAKNKNWNTRAKALEGAIKHYSENYVSAGQETIYYKKFNVKSSLSYANHQYMSNISGAYSEGFNMGSVLLSKLSDAKITFRIPVYSDMKGINYLLPDNN